MGDLTDPVAPAAMASPCTGICTIDDATDHCLGCGRTLDEIAGWMAMTNDRRAAVMRRLASPGSREA